MFQSIKTAFMILVVITVLTGVLYPAVVTVVAKICFSHQANGGLIAIDGRLIGAKNVGQPFSSDKYFWGRLSATAPMPYNAAASTGSNIGPSNPQLVENARNRIEKLKLSIPDLNEIPVDLVTASGSGLDPDISPQAAKIQVERVAKARNLKSEDVVRLVDALQRPPQFGVLGESRIDVLELNLALDQLQP